MTFISHNGIRPFFAPSINPPSINPMTCLFGPVDFFEDNDLNDSPRYHFEKIDDALYRLTINATGFDQDDVSVTTHNGKLLVKAQHQTAEDSSNDQKKAYRNIAQRNFSISFDLPQHTEIDHASLDKGLLHIDLLEDIPEKMKPRDIPIRAAKNKKSS